MGGRGPASERQRGAVEGGSQVSDERRAVRKVDPAQARKDGEREVRSIVPLRIEGRGREQWVNERNV